MEAEQALDEEARWAARSLMNLHPKDANDIHMRLSRYRSRVDNIYQCPKCCILHGVPSSMRAVPGTDQYDILRCNNDACRADIIIPI